MNWKIKITISICFNARNVHFPSFFWKKKPSFDKKLVDLSLKHSSCERVHFPRWRQSTVRKSHLFCGLGSFVEPTLVKKWKMKRKREINVMMHVLYCIYCYLIASVQCCDVHRFLVTIKRTSFKSLLAVNLILSSFVLFVQCVISF